MRDSNHAKTMNDYIDKQYEEDMNRQRDFEAMYEREKNRADELEKEKNDAVLALFNQKDYYGKLVSEQKQSADELEKKVKELEFYLEEMQQLQEDNNDI